MNGRREMSRLVALVSFLLTCLPTAGVACSGFVLRDPTVFGKNFDFAARNGYLMVNHRDVQKKALILSGTGASWVSRYGSLTFNQVSKEWPFGGMNEAGLVVELMSLPEAQYPPPDSRAPVPELQWIQYVLDTCKDLREVMATDTTIRITPSGHPLHFLVADAGGNTAAIEFIGGKRVAHAGAVFDVPVLTNSTYDRSLEYLREFKGFGGTRAIPASDASLDRFVVLAAMLRDHHAIRRDGALAYAFRMLDSVTQRTGTTVWSIVYDMKERRILFRTVGNRETRVVCMKDFSFACEAPAFALDLEAPLRGDVSARFEPYGTALNRRLVTATFARYRETGRVISSEAEAMLGEYPDRCRCRPGSP